MKSSNRCRLVWFLSVLRRCFKPAQHNISACSGILVSMHGFDKCSMIYHVPLGGLWAARTSGGRIQTEFLWRGKSRICAALKLPSYLQVDGPPTMQLEN